jgi:hypothetical protein
LLWYEQVATYDFQVATSYYGRAQTERHFGLGNRSTVDVVVEFPSGHVTRINSVAANRTINVLESASSPPALLGDYNQSAKVDAADYVLWRMTLGTNVAPNSGADGNGNGVVDQADYDVWRTHFDTATQSLGSDSAREISVVKLPQSEPQTSERSPSDEERGIALAGFDGRRVQLTTQNAASSDTFRTRNWGARHFKWYWDNARLADELPDRPLLAFAVNQIRRR